MYIILVYDVNKRRVSKVRKVCAKYLHHVQNSVFEGNITLNSRRKIKETIKVYNRCSYW